ncbi:MAG: hypothetical protein HZB65_03520 [Candidatus Aenigmarchaeota archaeon]|nr:hypothetical protein [Candidatus Aenigmarchaeota archaeon]
MTFFESHLSCQGKKYYTFLNKKKFFFSLVFVISLIIVIAVSGCINQEETPKELYNITKDGVEYVFLNNIYDTMNMSVEDGSSIRKTINEPLSVKIAFNGSNSEDNAYFSVVSYNLVEKLKNYYIYTRGKMVDFSAVNLNGSEQFPYGSTIILLKGPNTGANITRVYYDNACVYNGVVVAKFSRCIVIEGTDYSGLVKASERLMLFLLEYEQSK